VLLVARTGISLGFGYVYIIHIDLFPTYMLSTSYGICNVFSRLTSLVVPFVAEIEDSILPVATLIGFTFVGTICSFLL
jgi:hypothetical protein